MTEYDRILLKEKNEKMQRRISDMKEKLTKKRNKLIRYVDIRDTYERISKRDYVEELVAEEKVRREQEEQKRLHLQIYLLNLLLKLVYKHLLTQDK